MLNRHCVKYAKIRVFSDLYFPYKERIQDSVLKYGSHKTNILAYSTQDSPKYASVYRIFWSAVFTKTDWVWKDY